MRQLIIARKDLGMSAGKLAAQCCHASMAFLTSNMRNNRSVCLQPPLISDPNINESDIPRIYACTAYFDKKTYEDWLCGSFTKTICEAKNRNQMMKAVAIAEELGLQEGRDYFFIKDNCLTELEPEEVDENGVGRTLTCIGFKPLPDDIAHAISKKFQLFK